MCIRDSHKAVAQRREVLLGTNQFPNFNEKGVDTLIIGGGMSYTFTKAQGGSVGASLLEEDYLQYALDTVSYTHLWINLLPFRRAERFELW